MDGNRADHSLGQFLTMLLIIGSSLRTVQTTCTDPKVTSITPLYAGSGGYTKIRVTGCGFESADINGVKTGTVMKFVTYKTYPCVLTPTTLFANTFECITRRMPYGVYKIIIEQNGKNVPQSNNHYTRLQVVWWRTPILRQVNQISTPVGSVVGIYGRIFTDIYGSTNQQATNGKTVAIDSVEANGKSCTLQKADKVFYKLALASESTDWGDIHCKLEGTYVGNQNMSFVVEGDYGMNEVESGTLRFSKTKEVYMIQTYAEIESFTPVNGSLNGGTTLKMKVKHLQNIDKVKVEVGGLDCPITSKNEATEEVECTVPKLPTNEKCFAGGRGIIMEKWDPTTKYPTTDDISSAKNFDTDFVTSFAEDGFHNTPEARTGRWVSRMRGLFIPPYDGEYVMLVKADDVGTLYMSPDCDPANMVKVAHSKRYTTSYFKYEDQASNKTQLKANNKYYVELVHIDYGGLSHAHIGAQLFDSKTFTNAMLDAAKPHTLELNFNSDLSHEKQTVTVSVPSLKTKVHDVQTITIGGQPGSFRLSFHDVYTSAISTTASASTILKALKELPCYIENTFDFKVTGSSPNYEVEFVNDVGDQPLIKYWATTGVTVAISKKTTGQGTGASVQLKMGNGYTPPFLRADPQEKAAKAVEELFTSLCHSAVRMLKLPGILHYDYDTTYHTRSKNYISRTDVKAFCGKATVKNPQSLYEHTNNIGLDFSVYKSICFAYLEEETDISTTETNKRVYLRVEMIYIPTGATTTSTKNFYEEFPALSKNTWGYACFDLNTVVDDDKVKTGTQVQIRRAFAQRGSEITALHIDEVRFSNAPTVELQGDHRLKDGQGISTLRRGPIKAVDKVSAIKTVSGTDTEYAFTIEPQKCDNSFAKFETPGGQSSTIVRVTRANQPIEGKFKLTYKTTTLTDLPVDITEELLKIQLGTIPTFGDVTVEKTGDCTNFALKMKFVNVPGKMDDFQIDGTGVTGNNVKVTQKKETGYLLFDPIPGEFLRTYEEKPQVSVSIGEIPSKCSIVGGCAFQQNDDNTPQVTGLTQSNRKKRSVSGSTTLTLTGKNFDATTQSNNKVTVGGKPCAVTSATSTQIVCTIDPSLYCETLTIKLEVVPLGISTLSQNSIACTCTSTITTVSPVTHGLGGGKVTVTGTCFTKTADIYIDSKLCTLVARTPTTITCMAPVVTAAASNLNVEISQGGNKIQATQKFAYTSSSTYNIDFTPKTVTVEAGQTIDITGSDFQSNMLVTVDGNTATCTVVSVTSLKCTLPVLSDGEYDLIVQHPTKGRAVINGAQPKITYNFEVKKVCPRSGSLLGGTVLRFEGVGLAPKGIKVKIGGHECKVDSTTNTDTSMTCTIVPTATLHNIVADTTSKGSIWTPSVVNIVVGDTVRWCWNTSPYVIDFVTVEELNVPSDRVAKPNGFKNYVAASRQGCFSYQFNAAKTHYFWDGRVRRGTVHVKDLTPRIEKIKVEIGSVEAKYTVSQVCPSVTGICPGTEADIAGVTDPTLTTPNPSVFDFKFLNKRTPIIDTVTPSQDTSLVDITFNGKGLPASSKHCEAEILFAQKTKCIASSSSLTSMKCKIDTTVEAPVLQKLPISISVNNLGIALLKGERYFAIVPVVTSLSPCEGSIKGGTKLTIGGFSFPSTGISVTVGGVSCSDLKRVDFKTVTCVTPQTSAAGNKALAVTINNGPATLNTGVCTDFSYTTLKTPVCDAVSPDQKVEGILKTFSITMKEFNNYNIQDVSVTLDNTAVTVADVQTNKLDISVKNKAVGNHVIQVHVKGVGNADCPKFLTGHLKVLSRTPNEGGTNGGTNLKLTGNGFTCNTVIKIGGSPCKVDCNSVSLSEVVCSTPTKSAGDHDIMVDNANINMKFTYNSAITPQLTALNPGNAKAGDEITLTVEKMSATQSENTVYVNGKVCPTTAFTLSSKTIKCTLQKEKAGTYDVYVKVKGKGDTNTMPVTYQLTITRITNNEGSCYGGQYVTIAGSGIDESSISVTICGKACQIIPETVPSTSQLRCITPPAGSCTAVQQCDVIVTSGSVTQTLQFSYKPSLTPKVTCISPKKGGSGGGTTVTITGSNFGTDKTNVTVSIAGTTCDVQTVTDTKITCLTGKRNSSVTEHVKVKIDGVGLAEQPSDDKCKFRYVDMWSSPFTWGNNSIPTDGDFVVIPKGMDIVLDTNTANLSVLLIQGDLTFDDTRDIELHAIYILVMNGGSLTVGTEDEPYQNQATIMLHGNVRTPELPIFGSKVLAVQEGTLDLHGKPIYITWTKLSKTAIQGATEIEVQNPVEWEVGGEIAIASTGDHQSQKENEKRVIKAISSDKKTITLDKPLEYEHISKTETIDGKTYEFAGEVGYLTRNVKVVGSDDKQWHDKIEACANGFDTGEFATQTCFQGRFGEEKGSDQHGATVMVAPTKKDLNTAIGRFSSIEVTNAGQAFKLGRYPIHFHLNGEVNQSYVSNCAIHKTFNRAVNIHGTHYLNVTNNVIYDIMGGAFFFEDGIETNNIIQYNLALFVKSSTSLLNDDITPAAFWVTNPNNVIQHNAAAGGTHFGFWYRMHEHPTGPSYDSSICPRNEKMGVFFNNTCHSLGWFCIWVFPKYDPLKDGKCGSKVREEAIFSTVTVWNSEKGVEVVVSGSVILTEIYAFNNKLAGIEGKLIFDDMNGVYPSPMYKNSVIVARLSSLTVHSGTTGTVNGIVLPYGFTLSVTNIVFVNFDGNSYAFSFTRVQGVCTTLCGGFSYYISVMKFISSTNRVRFTWHNEGLLVDKDGTLTNKDPGSSLTTTSSSLDPVLCEGVSQTSNFKTGLPASICKPEVQFVRFSFNDPSPTSLLFKSAIFENQFGNTTFPWARKRINFPKGHQGLLPCNMSFFMYFENAEQLTNISYSGKFYQLPPYCRITIIQKGVATGPDRLSVSTSATIPSNETEGALIKHGDWSYKNDTKELSYLISSGSSTGKMDRTLSKFKAYKCYYDNCQTPLPVSQRPPVEQRPNSFLRWSKDADWVAIKQTKPVEGGCPEIPADKWMVVDEELTIKLKCIKVYGTLEFEDKDPGSPSSAKCRSFHITTECILVISGRLIVGWEAKEFCGDMKFVLTGNHTTLRDSPCTDPAIKTKAPCGTKAICAFGGLDMHGKKRTKTWTTLSTTADKNTKTLALTEALSCEQDEQIVVTPSGVIPEESEVLTIASISNDKKVLTTKENLKFQHRAYRTTANGTRFDIAAEVGCLTRNIKVCGDDDTDLFGARVLISEGYGRIENVEFDQTGQEGFVEPHDARFSLTYYNIGTVSPLRPCYIRSNSFHRGKAPAIGLYFSNKMDVLNNVIHDTITSALRTESPFTTLKGNLISSVRWEGAVNGRKEKTNYKYHGALEALADNLVLQDNSISGSQRVGLKVRGQACGPANGDMRKTVLHSNVIGLGGFTEDNFGGSQVCQQYNDLYIWGSYDFGIFLTSPVQGLIFNGGVYAENRVSFYVYQVGPSAVNHQYADYYSKVTDVTVIGTTTSFPCSQYKRTSTTNNIAWSSIGRAFNKDTKNHIGIAFSQYSQGTQMAPEKPFNNIMAYPTIKGRAVLSGVHFRDFKPRCSSVCDVAIATNKNNDDVQFPISLSGITLQDVDNKCKVYFYPPNVGKVNPSDCVDMDCDAHKKGLIKDTDGSFLGTPGAVVAIAEQHYNGVTDAEKRHGVGDYRIPKPMYTRPDGTRMKYSDLYSFPGILRNSGARKDAVWNAYETHGLDYYMLVAESMDEDTELRRLSPVALKCGKYLDLINGPQDHGWCFGYTCQKRLSIFYMIVAADAECTLYFTGTNPKVTRFFLLNAANSIKLKLSVHYTQPNQKNLFYKTNRVIPKNAVVDNGNFRFKPETRVGEFDVNITTDTFGANLFDLPTSELTFILQGEGPYIIKVEETIMFSVNLPPLSLEKFYEPQTIVRNLAVFLNIASDRIRIVKIVSESSGNRRKRETKSDQLVLEITSGKEPTADTNTTASDTKTEMESINSNLTNGVLSGKTSDMLNVSKNDIGDIKVAVSTNDPGDASDGTAGLVKIATAKEMKFIEDIQGVTESVEFQTQPSIRMYDDQGEVIPKVGTALNPWVVTAYIASSTNQNAELKGNTSVSFNTAGWANFTDLQITQYGEFEVFFNITSPSSVGDFTLKSQKITINKKKLDMNATGIPTEAAADTPFNIGVTIIDKDSSAQVVNVDWRNHVWKVKVELEEESKFNGTLVGPSEATFDSNTGVASLSALKFTKPGAYFMRLTVSSTPAEYTLVVKKVVTVLSSKQMSIVVQQSKTLKLKIDEDYDSVVKDKEDKFKSWATDILIVKYPDVRTKIYEIKPGSILIVFTVEGTVSDVNSSIYQVCSDVEDPKTYDFNGTSLKFSGFLEVDGASFYGVNCGPKEDKTPPKKKDSTVLILIIVSCAAALLLILAVVFFVMWKCKVQPNTKTKDINSKRYESHSVQNIEEILFREKSFQSLGNPGFKGPRAPAATAMNISHHQNGHSRPNSRSSVSPPPSYRSNDLYSLNGGKTRLQTQSIGVHEPPADYPRY